jgi:hypothetical protein
MRNNMKISRTLIAAATLGTLLTLGAGAAYATPTCVEGSHPSFTNGSFELNDFAPGTLGWAGSATVPGWHTTAVSGVIELWGTGKESFSASQGRQFLALESDSIASVYQDFATTPGQVLHWSLDHATRTAGAPARFDVQMGSVSSQTSQAVLTTSSAAWVSSSGTYTVPAGQTTTRFSMVSDPQTEVYGSGSHPSWIFFDNLVDNVAVTTQLCTEVAVAAAEPNLASTGTVTSELLPWAVGAILTGVAVIVVRRRSIAAGASLSNED